MNLDVSFLVRSHSGITLTPEGEQLYEHVAIAIEQLYQGESEILSNKTLEHGHISIGVSETALNIFLLSKLEQFHKAYPQVKIKLSNHSSIQAVDALEKELSILRLSQVQSISKAITCNFTLFL